MSPTPDSELVNLGTPATTGLLGIVAGIIAKLVHGRRTAHRRIKGIEATLADIQTDRSLKYQEFTNHRNTVTDSIASLRESVDRVDAKVDSSAKEINAKLDATAEGVAYIRGRLNGKDHRHG